MEDKGSELEPLPSSEFRVPSSELGVADWFEDEDEDDPYGAMSQSWRARHSGESFGSSQGLATRASASLDSSSGRFSGAANSSMARTASTSGSGSFSGDLSSLLQQS